MISIDVWKHFQNNLTLPQRFLDKEWKYDTKLSRRYQQTAYAQVLGQIKGFLESKKNDIKSSIINSSLDKKIKKKLLKLNRYSDWYSDKLLSSIFRKMLKKNRKPNFRYCNMALDTKVCMLENTESSFDYFARISTIEKGRPVLIPITSNDYFKNVEGGLKKFCQVNKNKDGEISFSFIKDLASVENNSEKVIGIDIGLRNLIATSEGDLLGRDFIESLNKYDQKINELGKRLRRQNINPRSSSRYRKLNSRLKSFIKNEVNRVMNKLVELHTPKEIILEKLDFRGGGLNKRLNRLISRFGKTHINQKLKDFEERCGIKITEINPAYTSQECDSCGFVDKRNRPQQNIFKCKYCGKTCNADIKASRVVRQRRSLQKKYPFANKSTILEYLKKKFISNTERNPRLYSKAKSLAEKSTYFSCEDFNLT